MTNGAPRHRLLEVVEIGAEGEMNDPVGLSGTDAEVQDRSKSTQRVEQRSLKLDTLLGT